MRKRPTAGGKQVPCRWYVYRLGWRVRLELYQDDDTVRRGAKLRDHRGEWTLAARLWRVAA